MVDFEKHNEYRNIYVPNTINGGASNLRTPNLSQIMTAIEQRKIIEFFYEDHFRCVEPHACGKFSTGNVLLSCWQSKGTSRSNKVPDWKLFNLMKIKSLNITDVTFTNPRMGYNPNDRRIKETYAKL